MSTGTLKRPFVTAKRHGLEALFRTPVPPFHVVFAAPPGFSADDPLYDLHRAANRIYRERLKVYQAKAERLSAPDLVAFIRDDVLGNVLAIEVVQLGPIALPRYHFLNAKRHWAWLPAHRRRAEGLLDEFRKLYRRRRRADRKC